MTIKKSAQRYGENAEIVNSRFIHNLEVPECNNDKMQTRNQYFTFDILMKKHPAISMLYILAKILHSSLAYTD